MKILPEIISTYSLPGKKLQDGFYGKQSRNY